MAPESKRLLKLTLPYLRFLLLGLIFSLLYASMYPLSFKIIQRFLHQSLEQKNFSQVNTFPLLAGGVSLLLGIFYFLQHYMIGKAGNLMIFRLRQKIYEHLQLLSPSFYERRRIGDLMSRLTSDIGALQQVLTTSLLDQVSSFFLFCSIFAYMLTVSWRLTALTFLGFPLIGWVYRTFARRLQKVTYIAQKRLGELSAIMQENLSNMKLIQAFNREEKEKNRFHLINWSTWKSSMKNIKVAALLNPVVELLTILGISVALWIGAREVIAGRLFISQLFSWFAAAVMITGPIRRISRGQGIWTMAKASAMRVFEILDEIPEVQDDPEAKPLKEVKGEVQFEQVTFSYKKGEPVLKKISFVVEPGECVALVGPSGAGKTTLVDLILRFYDPQEGRILLDGHDIRKIKLSSLRGCMAVVPQEAILFAGTIRENLCFGREDVTEKEIEEALRQAQCWDFVQSLPEKLETKVGERGVTLSGGQKQRMAIARALLKKPKVLILDEPTASLDALSEEKLHRAFAEVIQGRTTFIIAHRFSTVQLATRIFVISKGEIVEEGTHTALLRKNGLYAKLYNSSDG